MARVHLPASAPRDSPSTRAIVVRREGVGCRHGSPLPMIGAPEPVPKQHTVSCRLDLFPALVWLCESWGRSSWESRRRYSPHRDRRHLPGKFQRLLQTPGGNQGGDLGGANIGG